jgi:hypothetical protein
VILPEAILKENKRIGHAEFLVEQEGAFYDLIVGNNPIDRGESCIDSSESQINLS